MRSYKSYESSYIGDSDIAALILAGISDGDFGCIIQLIHKK